MVTYCSYNMPDTTAFPEVFYDHHSKTTNSIGQCNHSIWQPHSLLLKATKFMEGKGKISDFYNLPNNHKLINVGYITKFKEEAQNIIKKYKICVFGTCNAIDHPWLCYFWETCDVCEVSPVWLICTYVEYNILKWHSNVYIACYLSSVFRKYQENIR